MSRRTERLRDRRPGARGAPLPSILIVCEGEKTEPNYFRGFRISSVRVTVVGLGKNTKTLVDDAIARKEEEAPDRCWCVFDRDSFPAESVNTAIQQARAHGYEVAFSNECFELWYLLHFDFLTSALSRAQYGAMLTERLGKSYRKNSDTIYQELLERQPAAIRNAKKLLASYPEWNPARDNPSTTVHLLVGELNGYLRGGRPAPPPNQS